MVNDRERDASIAYILSQGLTKPPTARGQIRAVIRAFGLRFLFWDTACSILFALLTVAGIFLLFVYAPDTKRFSSSVAAAPALFFLIVMFTETAERAGGLFDLKQTCRFTVRQITAVRVMCDSLAGIVFSSVIALFSMSNGFEFVPILSLCLSALFLCAVLALTVMRCVRSKWASAVFSAVWTSVNLAILSAFGAAWEAFLSGVPTVLSLAVAAAGAAALAYQIKNMLVEVRIHAAA
jgi:hypothetical protein